LIILAGELNYDCYCSEAVGRKEYLYDVIWTSNNRFISRFDDVFMIAEIELFPSFDAAWMDFHKLLIGKAPVKLFVYNLPKSRQTRSRERDDFLGKAIHRIGTFSNTEFGEIYLFLNLGTWTCYGLQTIYNWEDKIGIEPILPSTSST
jgi:hypothetical protein